MSLNQIKKSQLRQKFQFILHPETFARNCILELAILAETKFCHRLFGTSALKILLFLVVLTKCRI